MARDVSLARDAVAAAPPAPVVAVPARNEAERLPQLMRALAGQSWLRHGGRLPVVVVLNNCTDGSAAAIREAGRRHGELDIRTLDVAFAAVDAHVGSARRLALDTAWAMSGQSPAAVLLTTDADARPSPDWVEANLAAIAHGADLVGGRIIGDPDEEAQLGPGFLRLSARHLAYASLADRLAALVDPIEHDPLPRHCDHTGASLAVRGTVYAAVGGLPPLSFREDLAFVSRVRSAGYRLRHAPEVTVQVSARLVGRAPGGMADCLRAWVSEAEGERPHLVEAPAATVWRLQRRRLIRDLARQQGSGREAALRALGLSDDALAGPSAVAHLLETLAPDEPDACATVPVEVALAEIERIVAALEGRRRAA